jgi:flagellin
LASKAKVEGTNAIVDKIGANGFLKINGVAIQIEEKDDLSTIIAKINQKSTLTGVIAHDNDGDQKLNLEQTKVGSKNKIQLSGSNEILNALGFNYTTVYGKDVKIGYNTSGSTDKYEVTVQGDKVDGSLEPINYAMTDGNHVLLGTDAVGGSDSADGSVNERKGALLNFDIMPSFTLDSINFKDSLFDAKVGTPYSSSYEAYRNDTQHIQETVNVNGGDSLKLHIGPNSDELLKIKIDDMSSFGLGISGLQVTTQQAAEAAIKKLDFAIEKVSTQRSSLGAYQNRLEHTINNLGTENQNLTAAESRIRDADMAKEMMVYTKYQVLVQSSMSMLAQANQLPKQVLQLLRQ